MAVAELREVQAQEGVKVGVRAASQVIAGQVAHLVVVVLLTMRVDLVAAAVAAQVAVESGTDVVKLVE